MMSITKIGREAANRAEENQSADDYERMDVSGMSWVKNHPTTAVGGTAVALRYVPGDPDEDMQDRGFAGLVLKDPFIYTDDADLETTSIFTNTRDTGDDYKVVNADDPATEELDGTGVDFDGNLFYGDNVEEFGEDTIILKLTGNAGRSATCCLDVHGKGSAGVNRDENGNIVLNGNGYPTYNGALIEHFPDNDDDNYTPPRFARDTQLRPDIEGKKVVFMIQRLADIDDDYEGNAYWSTMLVEDEDAEDGYAELTPTDEFEPDTDLVMATRWLSWSWPSDDELEKLQAAEAAQ